MYTIITYIIKPSYPWKVKSDDGQNIDQCIIEMSNLERRSG